MLSRFELTNVSKNSIIKLPNWIPKAIIAQTKKRRIIASPPDCTSGYFIRYLILGAFRNGVAGSFPACITSPSWVSRSSGWRFPVSCFSSFSDRRCPSPGSSANSLPSRSLGSWELRFRTSPRSSIQTPRPQPYSSSSFSRWSRVTKRSRGRFAGHPGGPPS